MGSGRCLAVPACAPTRRPRPRPPAAPHRVRLLALTQAAAAAPRRKHHVTARRAGARAGREAGAGPPAPRRAGRGGQRGAGRAARRSGRERANRERRPFSSGPISGRSWGQGAGLPERCPVEAGLRQMGSTVDHWKAAAAPCWPRSGGAFPALETAHQAPY
ncbi:dual specificity protein kinase CLK3-like [Falco rusticolus]|uniref:dual specificity protein kinase CLK3-like n=1 Tax=Falco rusticolus TaxID=120794 RepID=UPI001886693C|nr:dual specificity protein kinase CLK3-like [Falco rusticolus]